MDRVTISIDIVAQNALDNHTTMEHLRLDLNRVVANNDISVTSVKVFGLVIVITIDSPNFKGIINSVDRNHNDHRLNHS